MEPNSSITNSKKSSRIKSGRLFLAFGVAVCLFALYSYSSAPSDFVPKTSITVSYGDTSIKIADKLVDSKIIKSKFIFVSSMALLGNEKNISLGEYYFENPESSILVAWRIANGKHNIKPIKVTIPEGFNSREITTLLNDKFQDFDTSNFIEMAKANEGYLFPETYFFYPHVAPEEIIDQMKSMFEYKTKNILVSSNLGTRTKEQIVIMASIIEREAQGDNDREMIAGILWSRFDKRIPLQVDASVAYSLDKLRKGVTKSDLKIDTPYNTYLYKGLPPGPISNPGIKAIEASIHPIESPYLYYLHDNDGQIHYAKTYAEHLKNISKYLK